MAEGARRLKSAASSPSECPVLAPFSPPTPNQTPTQVAPQMKSTWPGSGSASMSSAGRREVPSLASSVGRRRVVGHEGGCRLGQAGRQVFSTCVCFHRC